MIDGLFFIVLVLNATGLFRFIAPQVGVEISTVSIYLLVIHFLYILLRVRYFNTIMNRADMIIWSLLLLALPLMSLFYAPALVMRDIGLQVYYVSLFFAAIVYTLANGLPAMHRVLSVSIIISLIGMILSMTVPAYFESVANLAEVKSTFGGRSYGFFMQPNAAANALCFLFIGWFALWKRKNGLLEVAIILILLITMFITGSRTGIVAALLTIMLVLLPSWKRHAGRSGYALKMGLLSLCLLIGIIGARGYISRHFMTNRDSDLINRVSMLLRFKLSGTEGVLQDTSVQARISAQKVYLSLIKEKPLTGHGLGSETVYTSTGLIDRASHSQILDFALKYGVLYPIAFTWLTLRMWRNRNRVPIEKYFQTKSILQFVVVLLLLLMISDNLLENRVLFVVLGMFLALLHCPRYLFHYAPDGTIISCATRLDILRGLARNQWHARPVRVVHSGRVRLPRRGESRG